jgi:hypothetical protein
MIVEIHSWYMETVLSIIENEFGGVAEYRVSERTGSTVWLQFKSAEKLHDIRSWIDGARTCALIYSGDAREV